MTYKWQAFDPAGPMHDHVSAGKEVMYEVLVVETRTYQRFVSACTQADLDDAVEEFVTDVANDTVPADAIDVQVISISEMEQD